MYLLLHMLGGLALLVLGIRFLRKGLDRLLGDRLPVLVARATRGPIQSSTTGLAVGVVGPSSTALSLLSISLVRDGHIAPRRAMSFLMGAYVGATIMVQLIAFNASDEAPILVLMGVALFLGGSRRFARGSGQVLLALGLIFLGIGIMKEDSAQFAENQDVADLMELAAGYPWLLALASLIITMVLQSSTATLAALLSLGAAGEAVIGLDQSMPAVVGANVGIAATALIAGWGQLESRRLALGVLLCRGLAAIAILALGGYVVEWIGRTPGALPRQIANMHTAFNLIVLVASVPVLGLVVWLIERIAIDRPRDRSTAEVMRLDPRWASEPSVAFAQTRRQIGTMAQVVRQMLRDSWSALKSGDQSLRQNLRRQDDLVDRMDRDVKLFLTRELTDELTSEQAQMRIDQLRFATDLERIADLIERDLVDIARKKQLTGLRFSDAGWLEIKRLFDEVEEALVLAEATFVDRDEELAHKLLAQKHRIRDTELSLRRRHYERLQSGTTQSLETTGMHLEAISVLKQIAHLASGAAYAVLGHHSEAALNGANEEDDGESESPV